MRRDQGGGPLTPIEELELTVRSYNCLKREGVDTIGQLTTMSRDELTFRRVDDKSVNEIGSKLVEFGYHLEGEEA